MKKNLKMFGSSGFYPYICTVNPLHLFKIGGGDYFGAKIRNISE
jgi:hypothetical protein